MNSELLAIIANIASNGDTSETVALAQAILALSQPAGSVNPTPEAPSTPTA